MCPYCDHAQRVKTPHSSCLAFHECANCREIISVPEESSNCCVICEYSDKKCPAIHGSRNKPGIKYIAVLALVSFVFHIIWENAQAPLYQGYESFWQHFPVCSMGAVGDVGITLVFAGVLWLLKPDQWMRPGWRGYAVLAIAGFFTAVLIEQHALLIDKWAYTQAMPLVPYFRVGLTPVLQMTVLLPLTFRIAHAVQLFQWPRPRN